MYKKITKKIINFGILIGIAIIAVLLTITINLVTSSILNVKYDVTEEKLYTLSDATKYQLSQVQVPITFRFYCDKDNRDTSSGIQSHTTYILDLLKSYKNHSSLIKIDVLSPFNNPEAMLSAEKDKITSQTYEKSIAWCGLSISFGEKNYSFPFLNPNDASSLEYEITRIIRLINNEIAKKNHIVGVITNLPIAGREPPKTPNETNHQPLPPWYFINDMSKDVVMIHVNPNHPITPQYYKTIILIHPEKLNRQTLYSLDQYLLQGGNLIVYIDPYCITHAQLNPSPEGVTARLPSKSNFQPFLENWGVKYSSDKIIADAIYKTMQLTSGAPSFFPTLLSVNQNALNAEHDVTKGLNRLQMILAGGFDISNLNKDIKATILCQSSLRSAFVEKHLATQMTKTQDNELNKDNVNIPLIIELKGNFDSCYSRKPIGYPHEMKHIQKSENNGTVYLLPDVDMLYDPYTTETITQFGHEVTVYKNDNIRLLQNILDKINDDTTMISLRNRQRKNRGLTKLQELAIEVDEQYNQQLLEINKKILELEVEIESYKTEITKLDSNNPKISTFINQIREKTPSLKELENQKKMIEIKKESIINDMSNKIKLINLIFLPVLILLIGFIVSLIRLSRRK